MLSSDVFDRTKYPASYQFSKSEIATLKKEIPKKRYKAYYAFYKKDSSKGCQLAFIIDSSPYVMRPSGYLVQYEIFCERELSNIEYQEQIENYGTNNRRFTEWIYQNVDQMIYEDAKYYLETPQKYIDECRKRGYSGNFQTKLTF
jgi:hypothetical protein